jgi:hypothetical protein
MKTSRALLAAAGAVALTLCAGCATSGSSAPAAEPSAVAEDRAGGTAAGSAAEPASGDGTVSEKLPSDGSGASLTPLLARTARVSLTVTNVEAAAAQLQSIAAAMGGQVTSENLVTRPDVDAAKSPASTIVISVPADRLDSTLDQLRSVGTLTNRVISSEDVTTQVADVDSRVKTLNASIERLRELSKRAGGIGDLTELESQLTDRISERDSLIAQQRSLAGRVAQSPVTLTLSLPSQTDTPAPGGFLGGLLSGWNALLASSQVLMTILGAVLPFLLVAVVVATPVLVWRRRLRRSRGTAQASASAAPGQGADAA